MKIRKLLTMVCLAGAIWCISIAATTEGTQAICSFLGGLFCFITVSLLYGREE